MAYTPINWQTGDTITAEKMNKMDNGWSVQKTQLFSETVTTVDDYGRNIAQFTYSQQITAKAITVTFAGVDYTIPRSENEFGAYYGEENADDGPVFTTYPFYIFAGFDGANEIYTETVGTYTVVVTAHDYEVSADFGNAVGSAITMPDVSTLPFLCVNGETSDLTMEEAYNSGRLLYFYHSKGFLNPTKLYIITDVRNLTFMPEDSTISVAYDSDGIFTVTNA